MRSRVVTRHTNCSDIEPLIALQKRVYPNIPSWRADLLRHQLETFPQGQIVAELRGELVGAASALVVAWDDWYAGHTWKEITARGSFDTHNPKGFTLYGAEVFVHPHKRGTGIGHALYSTRRRLCRDMNLKRIIACGRLPGYHRYADEIPVDLYVKKVIWGDLHDPVLSFQLREGFNFCGTISEYIPEDTESRGYASLIVWVNPKFNARKPTRITERELL